jgi:hypothetical protein
MIRHCVLLRFTDDLTTDGHDALCGALASLPDAIPEIERYVFGDDAGLGDGNWDFAVTGDFADEAAYGVYATHEAHVAVITDHIRPVLAERAAVQFQF